MIDCDCWCVTDDDDDDDDDDNDDGLDHYIIKLYHISYYTII